MVDPRPLLKGFGQAANVATQLATDVAVNGRRPRPGSFDISQGQLLQGISVGSTGTTVSHTLGRTPVGAFVLFADSAEPVTCTARNATSITLTSDTNTVTVDVWVV